MQFTKNHYKISYVWSNKFTPARKILHNHWLWWLSHLEGLYLPKDYMCLHIFKSLNIFKFLQFNHSNNSTNECPNIFVTLKCNQYFDKRIYLSINVPIHSNIRKFSSHCACYKNPKSWKTQKIIGTKKKKLNKKKH